MIDIDKYKIEDDVVWVWNDDLDNNRGWVLYEYKECPAEKGGYTLMDDRESDKTYKPYNQVLPALEFECKMDEKMLAIMDLPLIIQEVKRLREENEYLRESEWEYTCLWTWLDENTDLLNTIEAFLLSKWKSEWVKKSKEADE